MSIRIRVMTIAGLMLLAALAAGAMMAQSDGETGLPVEFSGTIVAINGTILIVNDQTVDISQVTLPGPLRLGDQVGVRGQLLPDGRIIAGSLTILSAGVAVTPAPTLPPPPTPAPGSQGVCPQTAIVWSNRATAWPLASMMLGAQSYSRDELLAIMNAATQGDASVRLARQMIAAKLNIANGSATGPIGDILLQADALLGQLDGRLPLGTLPTAPLGPAMITSAELLDSYNRSLVTPYCQPAAPVQGSNPTAVPAQAEPQTLIIEGPVTSVNGNIIRVFSFNVLVHPDNPLLDEIDAGDVIRVNGALETGSDIMVLVATTVVIVVDHDDDDRDDDDEDDEDDDRDDGEGDGRCANPPPDHAPAHGWRWQCEGGPHPGNGNGRGNGNGNGNGHGNGNGNGRGN